MRRQCVPILVAGDNTLSREEVASALIASNMRVTASVPHIEASDIESLKDRYGAIVLILIGDGSQSHSVIQALETLTAQHSALRVIVMLDQWRAADLLPLFRAGASACLVQTKSSSVLVRSIEAVLSGTPFIVFPETISAAAAGEQIAAAIAEFVERAQPRADQALHVNGKHRADSERGSQLSPGEDRILRRLAEGQSNKAIARALDVAEATVKTHIKAIFRKVNVKNRTQAAIWAANNLPQNDNAMVEPLPYGLANPVRPQEHVSDGGNVRPSIAPQLMPDALSNTDRKYLF
jgi:two-component system nitrate/nitrite response regulator NarL